MRTLSVVLFFGFAVPALAVPPAHATVPGRSGVAPAQVIDQLDVRDEGTRTVITIRASGRPVFTAFRAAAPNRLVVDVSNARLQGVPSAVDAETSGVLGVGASEMRAGNAPLSRFLVNMRDGATYTVEREPRSIVVTVTAPERAGDSGAQERIQGAERRAEAEEEGRLRAEERAREAAAGAGEIARERDLARAALAQTQASLRDAETARASAQRLAQEATVARQQADRARESLERQARRAVPGDPAALERARAEADRLARAEAEARTRAGRVAAEAQSAIAAARSAQAAAEARVRQADQRALQAEEGRAQALEDSRSAQAAQRIAEQRGAQALEDSRGAQAAQRIAEQRGAQALEDSRSAQAAQRVAEARSSQASAERRRAEEEARAASARAAQETRARAEAERRRATAVAQARQAQSALAKSTGEAEDARGRAEQRVREAQAARAAAEARVAEERDARIAAQRDAEAARSERDRSAAETVQARQAAAQALAARATTARAERDVVARRDLAEAAARERASLERRIAAEQSARRATSAEAEASRRRVAEMEAALARATRTSTERQGTLEEAQRRLADAREVSARADVARAESERRARDAERARDEAALRARTAETARGAADQARLAAETRQADSERRAREAEARAASAQQAHAAADERAVRAIVAADAAASASRRESAVAASSQRSEQTTTSTESEHEAAAAPTPAVATAAAPAPASSRVRDVRFEERDGEQRVLIDLTGAAQTRVRALGERVVVLEVRGAALPEALERTLDVTAFDGAVHTVSTYRRGEVVLVEVELGAEARNEIRREGSRLVWSFRAPTPDPAVAAAPARAPASRRAPGARTIHRENPEDYGMISEETASFLSSVPMQPRNARGRAAGRYRGRRIDLDFKDADIHNILRLVSEVGRVNIVTSDDVSGTVTIRMRNVPWDQALDVILQSKGLGMERQGNLIRVAPLTILEKEREMAIARRKQQVELEPLETRLVPVSYATAGELSPRAQELLSSRGSLSVDERTNVIIARDVAENLNQIEELVRNLDTQTPQVLIEARIVEANSNYLRELGIQWGGDIEFSSATGNPTGLAFPSNVGIAGGATDRATETSGLSPVDRAVANPNFAINLPSAVGRGSGGAIGMSLGSVTNNFNLNLRLSALEATGSGRIISEPRILTLDNREAHIEQGTLIPYSQVSAAGVQTAFQEAKLNLTVRPHVTADGSVLMHIKITRDEPDFNRTGSRGDPTINKREAETELLIEDGRTAVIGGIYTRNSGVQWSQVPFFANIPVVGWFFRNQRTSDLRGELLIFITPRIVNRAESIGQ